MKNSPFLAWCRSWSRRVPLLHGVLIAQMILMPFPHSSHAVWVEIDTDGDGIMDSGYDDGTTPPTTESDVDLDGLTEAQEQALGTNPYDPDTDDDGALDGSEVDLMGTDPLDPDSNDNGVLDYAEYSLHQSDSDGDSLTDWQELYDYFTDLNVTDTDDDGWDDGYEVITTGTSPTLADTDGDGLTDWDDEITASDPDGDFDGDGLSNNQEAYTQHPPTYTRTLIRVADSDGDGLNDGYETMTFRHSPGYETKQASSPVVADTDGDGVSDYQNHGNWFPSDISTPPSLTITGPSSLPNAMLGSYYASPSFSFENGTGTGTWSITGGDLPSEFSFNGSSLVGTPSTAGVYNFTVQIEDGALSTSTANYTLVVEVAALSIVSGDVLPPVGVGEGVFWQFAATGGVGGYVWTAPYGNIPAGLSLSSEGVISGSAGASGSYSFTARVTDGNGTHTEQTVTLSIFEIVPPLVLQITSSATLSDAQYSSTYSWWFTAQNGSGLYSWSIVSGSLPGGLSLTSDGELSGNVTAAVGTHSFDIQVTDSNGNSTSQSASLNVTDIPPPPIEIAGDSSFTRSIWTPSSIQFGCSSAMGALVWSADSLPSSNFSFDSSSGILSWAAEGLGAHTITVSVSDGYSSNSKTIYLEFIDQDADNDGVEASKEHDLAVSLNLPMHDGSAYSNGGGVEAPHDWLVYYHAELSAADSLTDTDGDGLGSQIEAYLGTDATLWDSAGDFASDRLVLYQVYDRYFDTMDQDVDGLGSMHEALLGTSDTEEDSDGDGLTDAWERYYIAYSNPAVQDTDGDGLHDGLELDHQTQARAPDTDGDYLTDNEEVNAASIFQIAFQLSPLDPDSDNDGVPDYAEVDLTDTDGAGIPDRLEEHWGLNPANPADEEGDVDSDEITNVVAYQNGYDIFANWQPQFDDDADGMDNAYELSKPGLLNKDDRQDGADDPDGDFLTNAEEYRWKTDPWTYLTPTTIGLRQIVDLDDSTGSQMLNAQGLPALRPAASDFEQVMAGELLVSALVRGNGILDGSREYDDDWDGDSWSNFDELYPSTGLPTNPREFNALLAVGAQNHEIVIGQPFFTQFEATGGQAPYNYSLLEGSNLPPGITFANGQLAGRPESEGSYTLTVEVTDNRGATASSSTSLEVVDGALIILTESLPVGFVNRPYSLQFQAVGGSGPVQFLLTGQEELIPSGLSLSSEGLLSGTPSLEGDYNIQVQAYIPDGNGGSLESVDHTYVLHIQHEPISVHFSPTGFICRPPGYPISPVQLSVSGGISPYVLDVNPNSPLLEGLLFDTTTRTLSGAMPQQEGLHLIEFTATDSLGRTGDGMFVLKADNTPPHLQQSLFQATAGRPISITLSSKGIQGGTFSITLPTGTTLPEGLTFNDAANTFSGAIANPAQINIPVEVGDGYQTITETVTIQVVAPSAPSVQISTQVRYPGIPFTAQISGVEGYGAPYNITLAQNQTLPSWLNFDDATDELSGTATEAVIIPLEFNVTDSRNISGSATVSFTVTERPLPRVQLESSQVRYPGVSLNASVYAFGGLGGPYAIQTASGYGLPSWLTFDQVTKTFSGIPMQAGSVNVPLTVTDNHGTSHTEIVSLVISNPSAFSLWSYFPPLVPGSNYGPVELFSNGDPGAVTFELAAGQLPPGLQLVGNSISGAATLTSNNHGPWSFTIRATNSNGGSVEEAFQIISAPLSIAANFPLGTPFTHYGPIPITAMAASGSVSFEIMAGSLPEGLELVDGTVSGTYPASTDPTWFTIRATDEVGRQASKTFTIDSSIKLTLEAMFPDATSGAATSYGPVQIMVGGGLGPYSFSFEPSLPDGLSLDTVTRTISGHVTCGAGIYPFAITATDGLGRTTKREFTLNVNNPPGLPTPKHIITTYAAIEDEERLDPEENAYIVKVVKTPIVSTGTGILEAVSLPGWLSFNGVTLRGDVPEGFVYDFVDIDAISSPPINTVERRRVHIGIPVPDIIGVGGSTTAYYMDTFHAAFELESPVSPGEFVELIFDESDLPDGLTLSIDSVEGRAVTIEGTANRIGKFEIPCSVRMRTTPESAVSQFELLPLTVEIKARPLVRGPIKVYSNTSGVTANQTFTIKMPASGGVNGLSNFSFSTQAPGTSALPLPSGVLIDSHTGVVSGQISMPGTYAATVKVENNGQESQALLTLHCLEPLTLVAPTMVPGFVNQTYPASSFTTNAADGARFETSAGQMPPGMVISASGTMTGIPRQHGSFTFTVKISDNYRRSLSRPYTLQIRPSSTPPIPGDLPPDIPIVPGGLPIPATPTIPDGLPAGNPGSLVLFDEVPEVEDDPVGLNNGPFMRAENYLFRLGPNGGGERVDVIEAVNPTTLLGHVPDDDSPPVHEGQTCPCRNHTGEIFRAVQGTSTIDDYELISPGELEHDPDKPDPQWRYLGLRTFPGDLQWQFQEPEASQPGSGPGEPDPNPIVPADVANEDRYAVRARIELNHHEQSDVTRKLIAQHFKLPNGSNAETGPLRTEYKELTVLEGDTESMWATFLPEEGEKVVVTIYDDSEETEDGNDDEFQFNDAAGSRYRKVALNGVPMPDSKPQAQDESGQRGEETYIDAYTTQLRHSVSDVYVEAEGSLLPLQVRRDVSPACFNLRFGLRPSERPDLPFGPGWSSNLCSFISFENTKATVTDESGQPQVFYYFDGTGWLHDRQEYGDGKSSQSVLLGDVTSPGQTNLPGPSGTTGLVRRYGHSGGVVGAGRGQLTFHKKFGTICTYEELLPTELGQYYSTDRIKGSDSMKLLQYARLTKVQDRLGNVLIYEYPTYGTLIPSRIYDPARPGHQITVTQTQGRIAQVQGPGGDITIYDFTSSAGLSAAKTISVKTSYTSEDDAILCQVRRGSAAVKYEYTHLSEMEFPPTDPLGIVHHHLAVSGITDERENTHRFLLKPSSDTVVVIPPWEKRLPKGSPLIISSIQPPEGPEVHVTRNSFRTTTQQADITTRFEVKLPAGSRAYTYEFRDPQLIRPYQVLNGAEYQNTLAFTDMRVIDPEGGVERYEFDVDANLALKKTTNRDGQVTTFEYQDDCEVKVKYGAVTRTYNLGKYDDPTKETDAMGHVKTFTYDDVTRQLASVSHHGASGGKVVTTYTFDPPPPPGDGTVVHGRRRSETTGYDQGTMPAGLQRAGGSTQTFDYDHAQFEGMITRQTLSPLSALQDINTPPAALAPSIITERTTASPNSTAYWWRTLIETRTVGGQISSSTTIHDFNGNVASVTDALNRTTRFFYDSRNRLTLTYFPDGSTKRLLYDPHGNIIQEQDETLRSVFHQYDALNRRIKTTIDLNGNGAANPAPADIVTTTEYNDLNLPVRETDPRGVVTTHTYDLLGRRISSTVNATATNPAERVVLYLTDNHLTTPFVDPDTGISTPRNKTQDFVGGSVFDISGFKPVRVFDARGNETFITYDAIGRPLTKRTPDAGAVQLTYHPQTASSQPLDQSGPVSGLGRTFVYDCQDRMIQTRFPDNAVVTQKLTPSGKPWQVVSEDGTTTTTAFDASGLPIAVAVSNGALTSITSSTYNTVGNVITVTDPRGNVTTTEYDVRNRPIKVTHPPVIDAGQPAGSAMVSPMVTTVYDAAGRVLEATDPMGATTSKFYDPAGRMFKTIDPLDHESTLTMDASGNVLTITNAIGQIITNAYNALGQLVSTTDHLGITVTNTYDKAGNRTSITDGRGKTTTFTYDGQNRVTSQVFQGSRTAMGTDAAADVWTYRYDAANKISETSPAGLTTSYGYDNRNRLAKVTWQVAGALTGNPVPFRNLVYDTAGRLSLVYESSNPEACVSYGFDALGRLTSETRGGLTYTPPVHSWRPPTYTLNGGITHSYSYDLAGNRTSAMLAHGRRTVTSYDALNRPLTISEGPEAGFDAGKTTTTYGYDLAGRALTLAAANGQTTRNTYDLMGRLTHRLLLSPGAADPPAVGSILATFSWTHDDLGNVTSQSEQWIESNSFAPRARITSMTYDDAGRLATEEVREAETLTVAASAHRVSTAHLYDDSHNRISKTVTHPDGPVGGSVAATRWDYTYNNANQLIQASEYNANNDCLKYQTLLYDANGNRKTLSTSLYTVGSSSVAHTGQSYTWDSFNRLTGVSNNTTAGTHVSSYQYDYRTRRIKTTTLAPGAQAQNTAIVFSGGLSVAEYVAATNGSFTTSTPVVNYTRGPDMGGGVGGLLFSSRAGVPKYNLSNGRGDIVAQSDNTATLTWTASYEAYGKRTKETGTNADKQRANTKDEDPTGLLNEGFRYRDIETGVWLSRDPAGFVDGPNLYAYVKQNPWTAFDPLGLRTSKRGVKWGDTDHHIVPVNRADANDFDNNFQSELNRRTIKTNEPHGRAAHGEYDRRVQGVIDEYADELGKRGISLSAKMTADQATAYADELVGRIKNSKDGYLQGYLKRVSVLKQGDLADWGWNYRFSEAKGSKYLAQFVKQADSSFHRAYKGFGGKLLGVTPYAFMPVAALGSYASSSNDRQAMYKICTEQEGMSPTQADYVIKRLLDAESSMMTSQLYKTGSTELEPHQEKALFKLQSDPQGVLSGKNPNLIYAPPRES